MIGSAREKYLTDLTQVRTQIYLGLVGIDMRHCSLTPDHTPWREAVATLRRAKSPLGRRASRQVHPAGAAVEIHDRNRVGFTYRKRWFLGFLVEGDRMGSVSC